MFKLELHDAIKSIPSEEWNALLDFKTCSPFIQHEYLNALEISGCVSKNTGWTPCHFSLRNQEGQLVTAIPLYLKSHSYGEYVFDWSWANAFKEHGLNYYPKLLSAIPFTPVEGTRLLGNDSNAKAILLGGIKEFALDNQISSVHILFPNSDDLDTIQDAGFMQRESIQFHWKNIASPANRLKLNSFDEFLHSLNKKRRNNIRRERQSIKEQGIAFKHLPGAEIKNDDWEHFYRCYANTYLEHGSSPYLNLDFFKQIGKTLPENIHLIIAEADSQPIAASLLFRNRSDISEVAYGRYWGSLKYIPNLHFETAYYQPIEYCISEGIDTFEGGAQGEHKIYRGMMPVNLHSAHFITDKKFSDAIEHFLNREGSAIHSYCNELEEHLPFKKGTLKTREI